MREDHHSCRQDSSEKGSSTFGEGSPLIDLGRQLQTPAASDALGDTAEKRAMEIASAFTGLVTTGGLLAAAHAAPESQIATLLRCMCAAASVGGMSYCACAAREELQRSGNDAHSAV